MVSTENGHLPSNVYQASSFIKITRSFNERFLRVLHFYRLWILEWNYYKWVLGQHCSIFSFYWWNTWNICTRAGIRMYRRLCDGTRYKNNSYMQYSYRKFRTCTSWVLSKLVIHCYNLKWHKQFLYKNVSIKQLRSNHIDCLKS